MALHTTHKTGPAGKSQTLARRLARRSKYTLPAALAPFARFATTPAGVR